MEKIKFMSEEMNEEVDFYVLEQTKVGGVSYILVTDSEDDDAECLILKDTSGENQSESVYEIVEDDVELSAVLKVFEELLEDVEIEMSISKEKFKEMLREKGLKVTNQRILVLEVLADHRDKHLTAEDIYELVREDYPEIGLATIYRTVQLLLEMQLVDRINLDDGCVRYEIGETLDGTGKHHHHHLICKTCGKVLPFKDDLLDELERHIEEETGFHVLDHELKFYGQCKECQKRGRKIVR